MLSKGEMPTWSTRAAEENPCTCLCVWCVLSVCTQLLTASTRDDESLQLYFQLIDKCVQHEVCDGSLGWSMLCMWGVWWFFRLKYVCLECVKFWWFVVLRCVCFECMRYMMVLYVEVCLLGLHEVCDGSLCWGMFAWSVWSCDGLLCWGMLALSALGMWWFFLLKYVCLECVKFWWFIVLRHLSAWGMQWLFRLKYVCLECVKLWWFVVLGYVGFECVKYSMVLNVEVCLLGVCEVVMVCCVEVCWIWVCGVFNGS